MKKALRLSAFLNAQICRAAAWGSLCSESDSDWGLSEPGVSHHSAALPPALASEWVLHSSDTSPSSKDEVTCGEYLCRIFVVSAAWMPPPSLSDSFLFWWVSHRCFMIFSCISSLRGSPYPFGTRLTLLVTSECFVGHSLGLSYLYSVNVYSFSDWKTPVNSHLPKHRHPQTRTHVWFILYSVSSWNGRVPWGRAWQHSNIFTWRIPWTEEPGGIQSMG